IINNSSDWLAELGLNVNERWKFDLGYQWDADAGQSQKFLGRIQYRRDSRRAANIAYRYRRDTLEEIDLSAAWPISDRWSAVARYNYSILDEEPLERFVGAEYQTCCWGVRVVYQRYVATRTGETDTAIALQLILKGLTNASDPAERVLGRGILGYDRD
ncbi:MAG: LPS assembly protein LptD, partial [Gammaproteobacteria bacterium]|nr:LPS assembly protein LptD [Gammaproteobacteria bacterium]